MRELHPAVNIAASPDSWRARLQVLVDDHVGPVRLDSRGVQPEFLDVAPPPGCNEDLVRCDLARFAALALDPCDLLRALATNGFHRPAGVDLGALRIIDMPDPRDDISILFTDDVIEHL